MGNVDCGIPHSPFRIRLGPDMRGQFQIEIAEMEFGQAAIRKLQRKQIAIISEDFTDLTGSDETDFFGEERQPTVRSRGCFSHAPRGSSRNARFNSSPKKFGSRLKNIFNLRGFEIFLTVAECIWQGLAARWIILWS